MIMLNSISIFNLPFSRYFDSEIGVHLSADPISKITRQNKMKFPDRYLNIIRSVLTVSFQLLLKL